MNLYFYFGSAILGAIIAYLIAENHSLRKHIIPILGSAMKALRDNNEALEKVATRLEVLESTGLRGLIEPRDLMELSDEGFGEECDPLDTEEPIVPVFRIPDLVIKQYDQSGTLINTEVIPYVVQ